MAVCALCLFLAAPWVGLLSVIVAFPDYTHLLLIDPHNMFKLQFLNADLYAICFTFSTIANQIKIKSNQINFIGIKSSHRTVTSHMYTVTVTQEQSQT